jgi:hypothetical protein
MAGILEPKEFVWEIRGDAALAGALMALTLVDR